MGQSDFKVALVRAFSQSDYKEPAEPLGVEALAAMLGKYGFECRVYDREMEKQDDIIADILAYRPSLVGLSVMMEDNTYDALQIIARLRPKLDGAAYVAGGLFVTTNHDKARARFPSHCQLIIGEGEVPLLRLCCELSGRQQDITQKNTLHPSEWPWLYRHELDEYIRIGAPINMRTSRGCPGQCRFCATPYMPDGLNKWQARQIADVADEMEMLCKSHHPHAYNFVDDDFGALSRVEDLTAELKNRGLRCALILQLRANTIMNDPNLYDRMKKLNAGGLCRVFIGLESFDQDTLKWFNKPLDPGKTLKAFRTIQDAGVAVHIGYILWHPMSTEESVRNEAQALWDSGFFTTKIVMGKLQLFPGCGLQLEHPEKTRISFPLEDYYNVVAQKIAPLYDAWLPGALCVPGLICLSWLEQGGKAASDVLEIEAQLARLDELSYAVLMNPDAVSDETISQTAKDVKERLHETGCTFDLRR